MEEKYADWNIEVIRGKIIEFKNDINYQKLSSFYMAKSYAEILGVERRELSHSNFLAWLLDYKGDHLLGDYPLRRFLDLLIAKYDNIQQSGPSDLFNLLVSEDYSVVSYKVYREYHLYTDSDKENKDKKNKKSKVVTGGRVDLLLEIEYQKQNEDVGVLKIVIENKVTAKEGKDQTNRYYEYFEKQKIADPDIDILYVYLVPYTKDYLEKVETKKGSLCENENFITVSYQDLVNDVVEKLFNKSITERTKFILKDYVNTLSQPALIINKENKGKELIMALGQEEKELLKQFWDKNEELILAALYALKTSDDTDIKMKDQIEKELDFLSNTSVKNKSVYRILHQGDVIFDNFIKADVALRTIQTLEQRGLINDDVLAFLKGDRSCSHDLIKEKKEVTKTEKKYNRFRVKLKPEFVYQDKEYYIARNWGVENTKVFMDKITKKFSDITFQEVE
ncbi:PD-(D/E)XK nuclease family protein [Myroides marinus]|uniref:PD-(D/E)XK nuclease family protein n=1 Tax=Myroides marinus TaxID=703342 RepID=UPI00257585C8|nr:PD-(D/E)XK nuclease family protein [Myroides marinus]MDM1350952.1 PD-(D/E)XK nuclease family protein [Myroides marinus]MDM1358159.1 PD-(D/E)XK nuclease family protein [Myroides marinus]